ncbi:MAG: NAD-dependent epimerase/dehydratase family protein [Microbacterium gubbeenense]
MTRVLVTGATGFLGRAVSDLLETEGTSVVRADVRASVGVRAVDVTSSRDLEDALSESTDAVIHLAAAGIGDSGLAAGAAADPAAAIRTNVEGFERVVRAAAKSGTRRVVWSSSTTIYGPASGYDEPIDEGADLRPGTVYGATKAACEFLAPLLSAEHGIEIISLRLPMVYGPGRWYGGSQQSLVELVRAIEAGEPYEIEAGASDADWIHVGDAAAAFAALLRVSAPRHAYHVVGHRGSLAEIVHALDAEATGITVHEYPGGAPDLPRLTDESLRRATGWRPQFPDSTSGATDYLRAVSPRRRRKADDD